MGSCFSLLSPSFPPLHVAANSASRNTRRISSSLCPRLPISGSPLVLPENHHKLNSSTSTRLSFWVFGHFRRQVIRKSSYRCLLKSIWDVYVGIFRHLQNLFWKSSGSERIWRTILAPLLGTASTTYRDATAHDVPYPEFICQAMMFLA